MEEENSHREHLVGGEGLPGSSSPQIIVLRHAHCLSVSHPQQEAEYNVPCRMAGRNPQHIADASEAERLVK